MTIKKHLNFRYFIQTLAIVALFLIPVPAVVILGISIYAHWRPVDPNLPIILFFIFLAITIIAITTIIASEKYKLPPIDNLETFDDYLSYFTDNQLKDFKYATVLAWVSKLLTNTTENITSNTDEKFADFVKNMYIVLKPNCEKKGHLNNWHSDATFRKDAFIKLLNSITIYDYSKANFNNFEQEAITMSLNKGVRDAIWNADSAGNIVYLLVILAHAIAIFLCTKLVGDGDALVNIFMTLPTDILVYMIYLGYIKDKK